MPVTKSRPRSRTIVMPEAKSELISTAAKYLGVSSEKLIQLAIAEKVTTVFAEMLST